MIERVPEESRIVGDVYKASHSILIGVCFLIFFTHLYAEDWPVYRKDDQRTGITGEKLSLPLKKVWQHKTEYTPSPAWPEPAPANFWHGILEVNPVMTYDRAFHVVAAGNYLYYGSSANDSIYCLDTVTGGIRWQYFSEGPVRMAPVIHGKRVYAGSDDGYLYCLDRITGKLEWKTPGGQGQRRLPGNGRFISLWPVRAGIIIQNDTVYFTAGLFPLQGVFINAVNAATGEKIWQQKVTTSPQGYMAAFENRLYVPTGRAAPYVLSMKDGTLLNKMSAIKRRGGPVVTPARDFILHGADEHGMINISQKSDKNELLLTVAGFRMAIQNDTLFILDKDHLAAYDMKKYVDINKKITPFLKNRKTKIRNQDKIDKLQKEIKTSLIWKTATGDNRSMIMTKDSLIVGGDAEVALYNKNNGIKTWSSGVDGTAYGLAVSEGKLYVSTSKGWIYCFSAHNDAQFLQSVYQRKGLSGSSDKTIKLIIKEALDKVGVKKGYCFIIGMGEGYIADEIIRTSDFKVIGLEQDKKRIAKLRKKYNSTGLYGNRISIYENNYKKFSYQKFTANLILSEESYATSKIPFKLGDVKKMLQPVNGYLGIALKQEKKSGKILQDWSQGAKGFRMAFSGDIQWGSLRGEPLSGAGEWTHLYSDPENTSCSGDTIIKRPKKLQWFGRPGPKDMIDRHHRNVPPLYKNGMAVIPGDNVVYTLDAYNGTILWKIEIPDSRRLGVFLDAGSMALDDENLYAAAKDKCHIYDIYSGELKNSYFIPPLMNKGVFEWGYLAYKDNILFGTGCKDTAFYREVSKKIDKSLYYDNMKLVYSAFLFGVNKNSGELLWTYKKGVIINTTITTGDGRVYFIESSYNKETKSLERLSLKTIFENSDQFLVSLNMKTGEIIYRKKVDTSDFKMIVYINYADNILLVSGCRNIDKKLWYFFRGYNASTGEIDWQQKHVTGLPYNGSHGEQNRHPTIVGDTIYTWPYAYKLKTGKKVDAWKFDRMGHGCGGVSASASCLFWRGGNPWMYGLYPGGEPSAMTKVTRPGCWINILPVGGLVLIPESSSGCTCAFPVQASMAFID